MNAFSEVDRRSEARSQRSEIGGLKTEESGPPSSVTGRLTLRVALLTGGGDKPYALGIADALASVGIYLDFIGSDDLSVPELLTNSRVNFLNLRGDQRAEMPARWQNAESVKVLWSACWLRSNGKPKLFHILWNNKFQLFDRTVLMLYYKLLGKKIVFTAHNVNAGKRDSE